MCSCYIIGAYVLGSYATFCYFLFKMENCCTLVIQTNKQTNNKEHVACMQKTKSGYYSNPFVIHVVCSFKIEVLAFAYVQVS